MSYENILNNLEKQLKNKSLGTNDIKEYKEDFLEMNIGSLTSIMKHAESILAALEQESVKNNLTESWLQGKIAVTEDYMKTIHDFVKYSPADDDKVSAGCGCGGGKKRKRVGTKTSKVIPVQQQNNPKSTEKQSEDKKDS